MRAGRRTYADTEVRADMKILFLDLGVDYNTPIIIKYSFWQMVAKNPNATYVCVNFGQATCPSEMQKQSICINFDIGWVIETVLVTC